MAKLPRERSGQDKDALEQARAEADRAVRDAERVAGVPRHALNLRARGERRRVMYGPPPLVPPFRAFLVFLGVPAVFGGGLGLLLGRSGMALGVGTTAGTLVGLVLLRRLYPLWR